MNNVKIPGISVCFVVKNGITNGYPFWESLQSCLPIADEIVISEGNSTDDTFKVVKKFCELHPDKAHFFRCDWNNHKTAAGEVIAKVSMEAMQKCRRQWIYYLQADELIHKDNYQVIRDVSCGKFNCRSVYFEFAHFIGSWDPLPVGGAAYSYAIRMVKNVRDISLIGDAWTFGGATAPVLSAKDFPKPIYHFGWVFPKNISQKSIEQAKIYPHLPEYQAKAKNAIEAIKSGQDEKKGLPMPNTFTDFPESMKRLVGQYEYTLPPGLI